MFSVLVFQTRVDVDLPLSKEINDVLKVAKCGVCGSRHEKRLFAHLARNQVGTLLFFNPGVSYKSCYRTKSHQKDYDL